MTGAPDAMPESGVSDGNLVVLKPFSPEELTAAIRQTLDRRQPVVH